MSYLRFRIWSLIVAFTLVFVAMPFPVSAQSIELIVGEPFEPYSGGDAGLPVIDVDDECGSLAGCWAYFNYLRYGLWGLMPEAGISWGIDEHVHARGMVRGLFYTSDGQEGERPFDAQLTFTADVTGLLTNTYSLAAASSAKFWVDLWDHTDQRTVFHYEILDVDCSDIVTAFCVGWNSETEEHLVNFTLWTDHEYHLQFWGEAVAEVNTVGLEVMSLFGDDGGALCPDCGVVLTDMIITSSSLTPTTSTSWGAIKSVYR